MSFDGCRRMLFGPIVLSTCAAMLDTSIFCEERPISSRRTIL